MNILAESAVSIIVVDVPVGSTKRGVLLETQEFDHYKDTCALKSEGL
ncbi:MAG: hypothetical protein CM15mV8_2310 [Caudoviricetes sp.]|nr:MAG: hypothetical protein CM15mV8_2310 [Caudoviricetes sp.]